MVKMKANRGVQRIRSSSPLEWQHPGCRSKGLALIECEPAGLDFSHSDPSGRKTVLLRRPADKGPLRAAAGATVIFCPESLTGKKCNKGSNLCPNSQLKT